ncbi:MAG: aldo/keto reductase [Clostridioides sp.]|jgi:predicted aldo/keto reductase-like oxidoreductase|nr:aldo/keto reductase [Clostridioides sp.]
MRNLGKTGMIINRLGMGGIPIQRVDQQTVNDMIDELIAQDINFIDTARGYTVSEEMLGEALRNKRDKFFLATKSMSRDYESMKKDVEISLNNLQTDTIDLYQFHNIKEGELEKILGEDGAYKALLEAKEQGKVKHIGITSHSVEVISKAVDMDCFETIQFPLNFIENQANDIFDKAHQKGIGTIAMKPLAGGALDDATLAIKYLMSIDALDVAIPGMDSIDQIRENINATKNFELTDEDKKNIEETKNILGSKFCRRCGYCMPCTVGIDIPSNFLLEGYYTRYNLKDWATTRYRSQNIKPTDCIDCGVCETRCPYELPIRDMLKNVADVLEEK